jgi:hypothetical protein
MLFMGLMLQEDFYLFMILQFLCAVWGPELTAEDFENAKAVQEMPITEEARRAIRVGIESEAYHKGNNNA